MGSGQSLFSPLLIHPGWYIKCLLTLFLLIAKETSSVVTEATTSSRYHTKGKVQTLLTIKKKKKISEQETSGTRSTPKRKMITEF